MSNVADLAITFRQTCYSVLPHRATNGTNQQLSVLNSFMLPRGDNQQMATHDTISFIVLSTLALAVLAFIAELGFGYEAKYGRFSSFKSHSIQIPAKIAWILQELPSFATASFFLIKSFDESFETVPIANRLLLSLFIMHYFNRSFIFPLSIRGGKPTAFLEFILAVIFTTTNGFLQGICLTQFDEYRITNITSFRFMFGILLFIIGSAVNLQSDAILRNLRVPGETGYKIPFGAMFEYVTCANYLGECVEWIGFAIAANNGGGFTFAFFTFTNLFPRAVATHKWYKKTFKNYPKDRKIFIPFLL